MFQKLGIALASLCLVSTLATAQVQKPYASQERGSEMTCTQEDVKGNCTAVTKQDGTSVAVLVEKAHIGDKVMCVQTTQGMQCTRRQKK
jgi:hypothetical protein